MTKTRTNSDEIADALKQEYNPEECLKYFMTHNPMMQEYRKQLLEQEEVKRVGYRTNDYCWNCKQYFTKLRYKICDNGYISYWCDGCY